MIVTKRGVVFLDRDGVINVDTSYVYRWEEFEFVPGAIDAMRRLCEAGCRLVVVTNQAGIARGKYTLEQYQALTDHVTAYLRGRGVQLAAVYHCPHHPAGRVPQLTIACACRKPQPGMLLRAADELGIDLHESCLVGDKPSDIEAAHRAGVGHAFLVRSDNPEHTTEGVAADGVFDDLAACVDWMLGQRNY